MKRFIILTKSYSGDNYHYFIESEMKPSNHQLQEFLKEHANDKDDEDVDEVIEIPTDNFFTIGKKTNELNKRYFIIRKVNAFTSADTTDLIGLTTDEDYAKSKQSVFCNYEEVKLIP